MLIRRIDGLLDTERIALLVRRHQTFQPHGPIADYRRIGVIGVADPINLAFVGPLAHLWAELKISYLKNTSFQSIADSFQYFVAEGFSARRAYVR